MRSSVSILARTASAELSIEKVFGPETPGGQYKHPASIEELPNGDLYIAYYGGEGEYEPDTAVFGTRLAKGTTQWSPPKRIADTPDRSDGNAVIWQEPGGATWLFYVVRYGETWSDSIIKYKYFRGQRGNLERFRRTRFRKRIDGPIAADSARQRRFPAADLS